MAKVKVNFINRSNKGLALVIFQLKTDSKDENLAERAVYCGFVHSGNYQTVEIDKTSDIWACVPGKNYEIDDIVDDKDRQKLMQLTHFNGTRYEVSEMDRIRS